MCEAFEVRKDGKALTPISPNPAIGMGGSYLYHPSDFVRRYAAVSGTARRVEQALIRSADRLLSPSDAQDVNDFVSTLGRVRDEAGHHPGRQAGPDA